MLGVVFISPIRTVVLVTLLTLLCAVILSAPVDFLSHRGITRLWGLLLVLAVLSAADYFAGASLLPVFESQVLQLVYSLPGLLALARAYVEHWGNRWLADLQDQMQSIALTPRERILCVFDALERDFEHQDFRGCAFINGAVEVADSQHPVHQACVRDQEQLRSLLLKLATDAGLQNP